MLIITAARFKIGHTPRKLPDKPSATFRFFAYQPCHSYFSASHSIGMTNGISLGMTKWHFVRNDIVQSRKYYYTVYRPILQEIFCFSYWEILPKILFKFRHFSQSPFSCAFAATSCGGCTIIYVYMGGICYSQHKCSTWNIFHYSLFFIHYLLRATARFRKTYPNGA